MKIMIDAFGGDNSPEEVIAGTLLAIKEREDFTAVLVGDEDIIKEKLSGYTYDASRVEIFDAKDVITCEEEPTVAVRRKPDSSIVKGIKELKENDEIKAFVSAGSTGAVLVAATLKLGRIEGISRPALCPALPTLSGGQVFLTDSGANADCKAINLVQFAVMAAVYAEESGIKDPKIALLSNGTEDEKGNALNHEAFPLLKGLKGINFIGNMEARDILSGKADIVVADGFSGNIALKSIEGAAKTVMTAVKGAITSSLRGKIGGLFVRKPLKGLKDTLDFNNKGGALFLGVNKPVLKAHGSSKRIAIRNTVLQAVSYAEFDLKDKIKNKLESTGASLLV